MKYEAHISTDGLYRYVLTRTWDESPKPKTVLFCCLNPSTADAQKDDPTLRRMIGFAHAWGFGRLAVVNLFAFRATNPVEMMAATDPVGPENDAWIASLSSAADLTVAGWGDLGFHRGRDLEVMKLLKSPHCLALTNKGRPRHPLYLRRDLRPILLEVR